MDQVLRSPVSPTREWRIQIPATELDPAFAERLDALLFAQRRSLLSSIRFFLTESHGQRFLCSSEPSSAVSLFEQLQTSRNGDSAELTPSRGVSGAIPLGSCLLSILNTLLVLHEIGQPHLELSTANIVQSRRGQYLVRPFSPYPDVSYPWAVEDVKCLKQWYQPPEVLLCGSEAATTAADMWAVGCICVELIIKRPLFEASSPAEQLDQIVSVLGSPKHAELSYLGEGQRELTLRNGVTATLHKLIPGISTAGLDFIRSLLCYDPRERATAISVATHPFLEELLCEPSEATTSTPQAHHTPIPAHTSPGVCSDQLSSADVTGMIKGIRSMLDDEPASTTEKIHTKLAPTPYRAFSEWLSYHSPDSTWTPQVSTRS